MEKPLSFAEMLADPEMMQQFKDGYARGEALAQSIKETPVQPEVTAEEIMPPKMSQAEMQQKMYQLMQKSMGQQEKGIEQLRQSVAQEQQRQEAAGALGRLDLRPFAQAMRQYGSTTVTVPTEAPIDRTEILRKLQETLSRAEQGLTEDQVRAMRGMMEDRRNEQAGISQKNQEIRMFNYAQGKYMKPAEDYLKGAGQYNFVRSELATGQPTRINRALSQYARIMGQTGVLTDNDIKLQLPPTFVSALDRAYTYVTGNPEAELPPEIVNDLLSTLDSGHAATQKAFKDKLDLVHGSFLQSPYAGMRGIDNLYQQASKSILGGVSAPKEAQAAKGGMSEAQKKRLQELKAKYGK